MGISQSALDGVLPLNGLRHSYRSGLTPWFIWGGTEYSDATDYFITLHARHLDDRCPLAVKFLLLPAGWRFLTDGSYEDVWFDPQLLLVEQRFNSLRFDNLKAPVSRHRVLQAARESLKVRNEPKVRFSPESRMTAFKRRAKSCQKSDAVLPSGIGWDKYIRILPRERLLTRAKRMSINEDTQKKYKSGDITIERLPEHIRIDLSEREFNFLREALREICRTIDSWELPSHTGWQLEEIENLQDDLRQFAEKQEVDM